MPITFNTSKIRFKDQGNGNVITLDTFSDKTTEERISEINSIADTRIGTVNSSDNTTINGTTNNGIQVIANKAAEVTNQLTTSAEIKDMFAESFSTNEDYFPGNIIIQTDDNNVNKLYKFKSYHSAGPWNAEEVEEVKIGDEIALTNLTESEEIVYDNRLSSGYVLRIENKDYYQNSFATCYATSPSNAIIVKENEIYKISASRYNTTAHAFYAFGNEEEIISTYPSIGQSINDNNLENKIIVIPAGITRLYLSEQRFDNRVRASCVRLSNLAKQIKNELEETKTLNDTSFWEIGNLESSSGEYSTTKFNQRLRTVNYFDDLIKIDAGEGYLFSLFAWDKNTGNYVGRCNTNGNFNPTAGAIASMNSYTINSAFNYKYKIVVRNANDSVDIIPPEAAENITLTFKNNIAEKIKNEISSSTTVEKTLECELGSINQSNGQQTNSNKSIRTIYKVGYNNGYNNIKCDAEYYFNIFAWDENGNYLGAYKNIQEFNTKSSNALRKLWDFDLSLYPSYIFTIVLFRNDGSEITLNEVEHLKVVAMRTVGNVNNEEENKLDTVTVSSDIFWKQGHLQNGVENKNLYTVRLITDMFPEKTLYSIECPEGYEMLINQYNLDGSYNGFWTTSGSWATSNANWVTNFNFFIEEAYFNKKYRIELRKVENENPEIYNFIYPKDGKNVTFVLDRNIFLNIATNNLSYAVKQNALPSWGVANILARQKQLGSFEWTPVGAIQKVSDSTGSPEYFTAGTTYQGMIYSSARAIDKIVGIDVSFKTFMTALKNPRSVLYTKKLNLSLAKAYYGMVCSSLVDYCLGFDIHYLGTDQFDLDTIKEVNWIDLQPGDFLYTPGHEQMITEVKKDEYGRITNVAYIESSMPKVKRHYETYQDFINAHATGYKPYRYEKRDQVDYTPIPYSKGYDDEVLPTIEYPDIMCEYGDEAVLLVGTDVKVNVINSDNYNTIYVKKDGTIIQTITVLEDFTLTNLEYGNYELVITDNSDNESSSTFTIVDANCSFDPDTKVLNFSSRNGIPHTVWIYSDTSSSNYVYMYNVALTAENITNGFIDLTEAFGKHTNAKHARILFKYNDSHATWFSYFDENWVEDFTPPAE